MTVSAATYIEFLLRCTVNNLSFKHTCVIQTYLCHSNKRAPAVHKKTLTIQVCTFPPSNTVHDAKLRQRERELRFNIPSDKKSDQFGDSFPSQPLTLVLRKLNLTQ